MCNIPKCKTNLKAKYALCPFTPQTKQKNPSTLLDAKANWIGGGGEGNKPPPPPKKLLLSKLPIFPAPMCNSVAYSTRVDFLIWFCSFYMTCKTDQWTGLGTAPSSSYLKRGQGCCFHSALLQLPTYSTLPSAQVGWNAFCLRRV